MPPKGWRKHEPSAARGPNPVAAPGRVESTLPRCERCLWFLRDADVSYPNGDCVRYPHSIRKRVEQWCGEFEAGGSKTAQLSRTD